MQPIAIQKRAATGDRREAIAAAARELIVEKGFEGLRTRDIAARVGINVATLHYHVPTKEALVQLVAESMGGDFRSQALRRPRKHLPPLTQLRMEFEDFREGMVEMPELIILFSELLDRARRDPRVDAIMRPFHGVWRAMVAEIFKAGVGDGSFRADLDPPAAAAIVTGALSDFWRRDPGDLTAFDQMAAELERGFVNPLRSS